MNKFIPFSRFVTIAFVFLFVFNAGLAFSQEIPEKLGGVKTDFIMSSGSLILNNSKQFIIKRAVNHSNREYAYGYESFHLEFASDKKIGVTKYKYKKKRLANTFYAITIYNEASDEIGYFTLDFGSVKLMPSRSLGGQYYYSINLEDISIALLNDARKIDIIRMEKGF